MRTYNFYVYIVTNYNKTVLYTGVTNDLERRLAEHYLKTGGNFSFTAKYKCFYLLWFEHFEYIDWAIRREKEIKGWKREKKVALINEENPDWKFLNSDVMDWPPSDL
jgi:putative endonuclease